MTIQQFTQLDEMEQVCAILQYGRLMAQNSDEQRRLFLYRVESFYVLACYDKSGDDLTGIDCFLEVNQMTPHFRKHLVSINPAEREN